MSGIVNSLWSTISSYFGSSEVDISNIDDMQLKELVSLIRKINPKKVDTSGDDYNTLIKSVEIDKKGLLQSCVQIYSHLSKLPEFKGKSIRKTKYVKPTFTQEAAIAANTFTKSACDPVIPQNKYFSAKYTHQKITVAEFNESFGDVCSKTDFMGISKDMLKDLPPMAQQILVNKMNDLLEFPQKTSEVAVGKCSFVYKEAKNGDASDISSFRSVLALPNVISHLHRILALRLAKYVKDFNIIDTDVQKAAMSGHKYPMFQQIMKVKNVVTNANKYGSELGMLFVDVSDAFPSLNINVVCAVLNKYNVDPVLINYIKSFYDNFEFFITTKEWTTDLMKWNRGLLQGCPLSPLLFVLVLDYMLRPISNRAYSHAYLFGRCGFMYAYMDDIAFACKDLQSMMSVYNDVKNVLMSIGLHVNDAKTKYMHIKPEWVLQINNTYVPTQFEMVDKFTYLGEEINSNGSSSVSYGNLLYELQRRLHSLSKNDIFSTEAKMNYLTTKAIPYINRRTLALYDISNDDKLVIKSICEKFIKECKGDLSVLDSIVLTHDVQKIIKDSGDEVLSGIEIQYEPLVFNETEFEGKTFIDVGYGKKIEVPTI